jgi:ABC-type multidrug transport system ATPase subunit/ABC-type multidrug transport system permease subunit
MIDGQPKQAQIWKKISGYAEQNDILNPYLSTLETLRFTANCRLPKDVDREEIISQVVELMDLKEWLDVVVGRELEGEGLPKHARKRLTIAVQLVVQPRILFLDEPTTGLGNIAAALVIKSIRRATDALGLITLVTIHQPSKLIWDTFDDLLLLAKGGRVAYMGEMGLKSQTVLNHFTKLGKEEPPTSCNPADYALSALTSVEPDEAVRAFEGTSEQHAVQAAIDADLKQDATVQPDIDFSKANSHFEEILLLSNRHLITQWRNPSYTVMRLTSSILVSLYMGVVFYGDKSTIDGAVFSIGAIFFLVFVLVIPMAAAVVPLIEDRAVLYRETVSGTYSRLSYGIGSLVAVIPFHLLNTFLMFIFFYFVVGFRLEGPIVGYFILMLFLANWVIMSMGQLFALASPNEESAHGLAGLSVILSVILMGFLITVSAMPDGWTWAYWINLFHYILQGLVSNELAGKTYHLDLDLGSMLPGNITNPTNLVLFQPGVDGLSSDGATEAATFLSVIAAAGNGNNSQSATGDVLNLLSCFAANGCMETPPLSTVLCISGLKPPCKDEFDLAVASFPLEEITECFAPEFGGNATFGSEDTIDGTPGDFSVSGFEQLSESGQWSLLFCLIRSFLPPVIDGILKFILERSDIILVLIDVVQNGIDLPGEAILFFFGWADFEDGSFQANYKWHYCLTAVVGFLVGIEIFKLAAIRFIVWTKR